MAKFSPISLLFDLIMDIISTLYNIQIFIISEE